MSSELVRRLYDDHAGLLAYLTSRGEISFATAIESSFPKVVLLAAASDLETRVTDALIDYFTRVTGSTRAAVSFVRNKAIARQYHTYFDWRGRSANQFFGLFGDEFKTKMKATMRLDGNLSEAISAFCEVGDLRNQLVHENYAAFTVEKTADEVHALYEKALVFVTRLPDLLDKSGNRDDWTSADASPSLSDEGSSASTSDDDWLH